MAGHHGMHLSSQLHGKAQVERCGEQIMKSLWEHDISIAVPNNLQTEFGMAPAAAEDEGKMQHSW
jgi:hypothetical protein